LYIKKQFIQHDDIKNENMIKVFIYSALLFILNFACCAFSFSQDADKLAKLRLAQGFEESGEWERALPLYENLNTVEPNNFLFLDGLQRCYTQIKEYDKAIKVIRRWLMLQPQDVNKMVTLGGLYYDSGAEASADSVWNHMIATEPKNMQLYRMVANEQLEHRLYDQCIQTYLQGRSMSTNDAEFADELGNLYSALQQYISATTEYLRLIKAAPDQLPLVQSRLSVFTAKPEGIHAASETVKEELDKFQDNSALHRLYAWLLLEERAYEPALEQYRIIDRRANAKGNEIFNFAQRLHQEHAYRTAAEAFKEIMEGYKNSPLLPSAQFGYARAEEELIALTDSVTLSSEAHPSYTTSIQMYESIAAEYRNIDLAAQALFRIGVIKFDKLFDLDGAFSAFTRIKNIPSTATIIQDAELRIGDIQTARNDLASARAEYDEVSRSSLVVYQDQAAFKLAELNYFEGKFDTALTLLKHFNSNLGTDLANDALQLQYFIQENNNSAPQALTEFAKADLLQRQHKYSESLVQFQDIVKRYSTTLLVDDAMMKIGELYVVLKRPQEAIRAFHFIADSIQSSILKDRAQFHLAEICQKVLNDKTRAIEAYEKLLSQFPNSLYVEEARKRIRILRGDKL
jgi:tetratricopeptide (TPR) repeat protein